MAGNKKNNNKPKQAPSQVQTRNQQKRGGRRQPTTMGRAMRAAGAAVGHVYGGPAGQLAGYVAGTALSKITGQGDYTVSQPGFKLRNNNLSKATATFTYAGNTVRIRHREFLGDIVTPATPAGFNITGYTVNAADPTTFPWLSVIARRFQKYKFNGLVFQYVSTSSSLTNSTALGSIFMASNYNSEDPAFVTKAQMTNTSFAISGVPSDDCVHPIECAPADRPVEWFYTRRLGIEPTNVQMYDLCDTYFATQGLTAPSGTTLGELYVTYDVTLSSSIIDVDNVAVNPAGSFYESSSSGVNRGLDCGPFQAATDVNTIADGFLTVNGTDYPNKLIVVSQYITGTAVTNLMARSFGYPLMIGQKPEASVTSAVGGGSNYRVWFTRAGRYMLQIQYTDTTTQTGQATPWASTGNGATCVSVNDVPTVNTGSTAATYLINVAAFDTIQPGTSLPYINFTSASQSTHDAYKVFFAILV